MASWVDYAIGGLVSGIFNNYFTNFSVEYMSTLDDDACDEIQSMITSNGVEISDILYGDKLLNLFASDFNINDMKKTCKINSKMNEMIAISSFRLEIDTKSQLSKNPLQCSKKSLKRRKEAFNSLFGYNSDQIIRYINIIKSKGMTVGHIPINVYEKYTNNSEKIYQLQILLHDDMVDLSIVDFTGTDRNKPNINPLIKQKVYLNKSEADILSAKLVKSINLKLKNTTNPVTADVYFINNTVSYIDSEINQDIDLNTIDDKYVLVYQSIQIGRGNRNHVINEVFHDVKKNALFKYESITVETALKQYVISLKKELKAKGMKIGSLLDKTSQLTGMPSVLSNLIMNYYNVDQINTLTYIPPEEKQHTDLQNSHRKILNLLCCTYKRFVSLDLSGLIELMESTGNDQEQVLSFMVDYFIGL
jgi:hypothetical protein